MLISGENEILILSVLKWFFMWTNSIKSEFILLIINYVQRIVLGALSDISPSLFNPSDKATSISMLVMRKSDIREFKLLAQYHSDSEK